MDQCLILCLRCAVIPSFMACNSGQLHVSGSHLFTREVRYFQVLELLRREAAGEEGKVLEILMLLRLGLFW